MADRAVTSEVFPEPGPPVMTKRWTITVPLAVTSLFTDEVGSNASGAPLEYAIKLGRRAERVSASGPVPADCGPD